MRDQLPLLKTLSEKDIAILTLIHSKATLPAEVQSLRGLVEGPRKALEEVRGRIDTLEAQLNARRSSLVDEEAALQHSQDKQSSVQNNREYDAVHAEILVHTERLEDLRTDIDMMSQELTRLREAVVQLEATFAEANEKHAAPIAELEARLAAIDGKIEAVKSEKNVVEQQLRSDVRSYYRRLLDSKKPRLLSGKQETVIACIVNVSHSCPVCHGSLPRPKIQAARKMEKLETCSSCGSILVWDE